MQVFFFFQAEDGIRDYKVTGVQTCALPISTILGAGGHELRTVRFIEGDVWCRVLRDVARMPRAERPGSPNVLRARVDRVRARHRIRVTYLRPVEPNRFAAVHDRGGADHPSLRVAV